MRSFINAAVRGILRVSSAGLPRRWQFSRYAMYSQIESFCAQLPNRRGRILSISHSVDLADAAGISAEDWVEANYPEISIFSLPFEDESFDWVLSDQVFEHLEGTPQAAIDETLRVLKPGGQFIHTTCFLMAYHGTPGELEDFWRFSPSGLKYLCRSAATSHADGAGNPLANLLNSFGVAFELVPTARWHPIARLLNWKSPGHASTVWVWGKK